MLGATAGRTTLNGEGLQHEDGHSLLHAMTVPACVSYDVSFAFELAAIIEDGLKRMYVDDENIYYYITLQNEDYRMPPMPEGVKEGILKGIYRFKAADQRLEKHVELFGSGSHHAAGAARPDHPRRALRRLVGYLGCHELPGCSAPTRSTCERYNRLHPDAEPRVPYVQQALKGVTGPFITASDYMKSLGDLIRRWLPGRLVPLGTDGFGMSDTREQLRRHFEVDAESIVIGALDGLRQEGKLSGSELARAIHDLGVNPDKVAPLSI